MDYPHENLHILNLRHNENFNESQFCFIKCRFCHMVFTKNSFNKKLIRFPRADVFFHATSLARDTDSIRSNLVYRCKEKDEILVHNVFLNKIWIWSLQPDYILKPDCFWP